MSASTPYEGPASEKNWLTLLICILVAGSFAAHRFYVGKIGTAILFICTAGGFLVWWIMDLIKIIKGEFTDSEGRPIPKPQSV